MCHPGKIRLQMASFCSVAGCRKKWLSRAENISASAARAAAQEA